MGELWKSVSRVQDYVIRRVETVYARQIEPLQCREGREHVQKVVDIVAVAPSNSDRDGKLFQIRQYGNLERFNEPVEAVTVGNGERKKTLCDFY